MPARRAVEGLFFFPGFWGGGGGLLPGIKLGGGLGERLGRGLAGELGRGLRGGGGGLAEGSSRLVVSVRDKNRRDDSN
jgi:hypothetical protein